MQQRSKKEEKAERAWLWKLAASVIIAALVVVHIGNAHGVSTLSDEFGYWGTAAIINGYNWTGTLNNFPYFSFIYSLILCPIMALPVGATVMFRIALIINALMLVVTFWISCACAKRMYPALPERFCALLCAAITVYSAYIYDSQNTSGEILNVLLFWVLFYVCLRFVETPKVSWAVWMSVLAVLNFAAHMRSLSLLLAAVVVIFITAIGKRTSWKLIPAAGITIGIGLLIFIQTKNLVIQNVYGAGELAAANDVGAQAQKLSALFDPATIYNVFVMCWGRLFYLGTASFLLIYIGVVVGAVALYKTVRTKGKATNSNTTIENNGIASLFLLLALLFSIGISSVFVLDPGDSITYLYYGRYTEYIVGPLIMIGFVSLYRFTKKERKIVFGTILFHFALSVWMYLYMWQNGVYRSAPFPNIAGVSGMLVVPGLNTQQQYTFGIAIEAILIFILLCGTIWSKCEYKFGAIIKLYGAPVLLGVVWTLAGISYVYNSLYTKEKIDSQKSIAALADVLENTAGEQTVVFPFGGVAFRNGSQDMVKIQFLAKDTKIQMVNMENAAKQIDWEETPYLLWSGNEDYPEDLLRIRDAQYVAVAWADNLSLYVRAADGDAVASFLQAKWAEPISISVQSVERSPQTLLEQNLGSGWGEVNTENVNNDQGKYAINTDEAGDAEGAYAVYGPYLTLAPGKYQVTFTLELLDEEGKTEELGVCDVSAYGGSVISEYPLSKSDFKDANEQQITLEFQTENWDMTGVEFRLFVEPGVQFRVTDISYQCVSLERQAMLPESEDYQLLRGVLDRDTDVLPVRIIAEDGLEPLLSCSQLQEALADTGREVSIVKRSELGPDPAVLLVPAEDTDLLFDLLPDFTVLVRMEEYALLVPSGYSVETAFRDVGGRPMSEGNALNLRYFLGAGEASYGNLAVNIPAGDYELRYRLSLNGTPLWSELGTLTLSGGNLSEQESLTAELFDDGYGTYENSRMLSLEESGQLRVGVSVHSGVSVVGLEAYLIRQ